MSRKKNELTHKFRIAITLPPSAKAAFDPDEERSFRRDARILTAINPESSVYVQLENARGERRSYFYDNYESRSQRLSRSFTVIAALMGVGIAFEPLFLPLLGAQLTLPFLAATTGCGVIRRVAKPIDPHTEVEFLISSKKYHLLDTELRKLVQKRRHGIYSTLLNNCATFAIGFAHKHGFDVPRPLLPTPYTLARAIRNTREQPAQAPQLTG